MGWVVSTTPRPLYPPGKDPVPIVQEVGWAPGSVWTGAEKLVATGIRSPYPPARSSVAIPTELSRSMSATYFGAFLASRQGVKNFINHLLYYTISMNLFYKTFFYVLKVVNLYCLVGINVLHILCIFIILSDDWPVRPETCWSEFFYNII